MRELPERFKRVGKKSPPVFQVELSDRGDTSESGLVRCGMIQDLLYLIGISDGDFRFVSLVQSDDGRLTVTVQERG